MVVISIPAGWVYPTLQARKMHHFPQGKYRSSCGRWTRFPNDNGQPDPPLINRCTICSKKVQADG